MKFVAQRYLEISILTVDRGRPRKIHQQFTEVSNVGLYLHGLCAPTHIVYRAGVDKVAFFEYRKVCAYLLYFIQQVTCQDDGLATGSDLFRELANFGDAHRI